MRKNRKGDDVSENRKMKKGGSAGIARTKRNKNGADNVNSSKKIKKRV